MEEKEKKGGFWKKAAISVAILATGVVCGVYHKELISAAKSAGTGVKTMFHKDTVAVEAQPEVVEQVAAEGRQQYRPEQQRFNNSGENRQKFNNFNNRGQQR